MLPSGKRVFAIPAVALLAAACAQAPRAKTIAAAPPALPAAPSAIDRSTELFYAGKEAALSGDFDCAEAQFQLALNAVIPPGRPRPAPPDIEEFSASLYDSIQRYEAMAPSSDADAAEPRGLPDELQGVSGQTSEADLQRAREAVGSDERAGTFDIPITVNDPVLAMIASFTARESVRERFSEGLVRAGRYMPMIRETFRKAGLPGDLAYVAMIESSFKTGARSRARAQGVWQFIAPTGRRYGLRSSRAVDERSDPVKATQAAAAYFRDLFDLFGDWYLAMAAYDCGEGRVARAIARTGTENYWELSRLGALPRETRLYVPSVIAAALIDKNQEHYGFAVDPEPPLEFETATLRKPVDLRQVARASGVAYDALSELNPELRTFVTPKESAGYALRVPKGFAATIEEAAHSLPEAAVPAQRRHRVRKGETLARVARRFGVSAAALADANDLPRGARLAPSRVLVIPDPDPVSYATRRRGKRAKDADAGGSASQAAYRVRKGDTLFSIATRHHTTVDKLREWNGLEAGGAIRPGDRLSVSSAR